MTSQSTFKNTQTREIAQLSWQRIPRVRAAILERLLSQRCAALRNFRIVCVPSVIAMNLGAIRNIIIYEIARCLIIHTFEHLNSVSKSKSFTYWKEL